MYLATVVTSVYCRLIITSADLLARRYSQKQYDNVINRTRTSILLSSADETDRECETLTEEMDAVAALTGKLIAENASAEVDRDEYNRKYDGFTERYDKAQKRCEALKRRKVTLLFEVDMVECFLTEIRLMPELPITFDERHWNKLIDHVTVYSDDRLLFTFKTGVEITERL